MKTICVVIPYFGNLPRFFSFWLHSALNNPTVDFLLVTDCDMKPQDNVKVVKMSFDELKERIQKLFDNNISLLSPYKLCDFKGAYGYIFKQFIEGYDFWGFGDLDLVYGDIRSFLTDDVLLKYDVISGWGHFTLYRNNKFCNEFFMRNEDGFLNYKEVFTSERSFCFDEYWHKGLSDLWERLYPERIWRAEKFFDDVRIPSACLHFFSNFSPEKSNCLIFEYEGKRLWRVYIGDDGQVHRESILYAHFQRRKFLKCQTIDFSHYLIKPNRIIDYKQLTLKSVRRMGRSLETQRKIRNFKERQIARIKCLLRFR